jgi:hypothetical protein
MPSAARTYAENELGVHLVFKEANDAHDDMVKQHSVLAEMKAWRREITEDILDLEASVLDEIRKQHPDLSATAHDQKAKLQRRSDARLVDLRKILAVAQGKEDTAEHAIKACDNRIKIATARMTELGGYLPYLTMVWTQDAIAKQTQQGSEQA